MTSIATARGTSGRASHTVNLKYLPVKVRSNFLYSKLLFSAKKLLVVSDVEYIHLDVHIDRRPQPQVEEGGTFREAHSLSHHSERNISPHDICTVLINVILYYNAILTLFVNSVYMVH